MNKIEKVNQFKSDLRSVDRWIKELREVKEKLEVVSHKLRGVKAVHAKTIIYENVGDPYHPVNFELMEEEWSLIEEKERLTKNINVTYKRLKKITNFNDRMMIEELYLNHVKHDEVIASNYGYTKKGMYKHITKIINEIY